MKASHTFNMLDARGLISVSERAHYIARVRNLMRRVARAYVEQREALGHPLLGRFGSVPLTEQPPARPAAEPSQPKADLLLEIGSEEIPASYIPPALEQMRQEMEAWLREQRLEFDAVLTAGTPRRLTLAVRNLSTRQPDAEVEVSGPPRRVAFDAEGNPTQAAIGFARAQGVTLEELYVRETERGEYVFARKRIEGRRTGDLLAEFLPELIRRLRFPKAMRWDRSRFARPIRWIVALLGDQVVDFPFDTLRSGRTTRGHRFLSPSPTLELLDANFERYKSLLREHFVIADIQERRDRIRSEVARLLRENGSPERIDEELLEEVLFLVENPEAVLGYLPGGASPGPPGGADHRDEEASTVLPRLPTGWKAAAEVHHTL
ncbi:MAG: hypothetical protein KatS3mg115_0281 [Candidatus Poribacteria bacterium]|nr:MAG: hypothetical protein KatS3mg115_0281 [Candidatus Poribacteria bacterium]